MRGENFWKAILGPMGSTLNEASMENELWYYLGIFDTVLEILDQTMYLSYTEVVFTQCYSYEYAYEYTHHTHCEYTVVDWPHNTVCLPVSMKFLYKCGLQWLDTNNLVFAKLYNNMERI